MPSLKIHSLSKVCNVETSQLEDIPCHEWYSVLLGSTQLSLLVSTRWEPGSLSRVVDQVGNLVSHGLYLDLSRGMKVNEI